jgi:hypothetical protein
VSSALGSDMVASGVTDNKYTGELMVNKRIKYTGQIKGDVCLR